MKRFWILFLAFLLSGCVTIEKKPIDYTSVFAKAGLNIDTNSNDKADVPYGGSDAGTFTDGGILLGAGTSAFEVTALGAVGGILYGTGANPAWLAAGATGKMLIAKGAAAPEWTPYTFPATVPTVGKVLISDGTNLIGSTALGTGAYATIADYAPLASPTFTGTVVLPTTTASGTLDQTITTTTAGGETGHYSYITHSTNALTGELIGVHGNARVDTIDSLAAGTVMGGKFQAGNFGTGTDLLTATGVYTEVVNKIPSGATTWTWAKGYEANMDLDQGSAGNVNTITNSTLFYGVYNLPTVGTYATVTNGYGVYVKNEAVGGTGQMLDAAFYAADASMSGGIYGWDYGLDFSGIASGAFGHADIRGVNSETISNNTDGTWDFGAANLLTTGNIAGTTYGSDSSISNAEFLTLDDGALTQILVGGGAGSAPIWTTASGTGAPVRVGSPTFTTTAVLPNLNLEALTAEPTEVVGRIYRADNDTWDPCGIDGVVDYFVICTAEDTYIALWDIAGNFYFSTIQAAMKVIPDADGITLTAAQMNAVIVATNASEVQIPADQCDTVTGKWVTVKQTGAYAVDIAVLDAADDIYMTDGTKVEGTTNELQTAGAAGNQITLMCIAVNEWWVTGEIGTSTSEAAD